MQVILPDEALPATLKLNPELPMGDDEFCMANPDLSLERTEEGEIIIVPPAGGDSSFESLEISGSLREWAKKDGRGRAFDSSIGFILPTSATLSPDAAWLSKERLSKLSKRQKKKFLPLCPEFVVEVTSSSDRLRSAMQKMESWVRGGIELGWLIGDDNTTVYIYRKGQPKPEKLKNVSTQPVKVP
jgi:Uma2 family endonuclease